MGLMLLNLTSEGGILSMHCIALHANCMTNKHIVLLHALGMDTSDCNSGKQASLQRSE